ncbi:MAG TPA: tRNA (guanosine(46)-N7)-methyltransferase TrmB [Flavobacteriaceae bacterium]|nr:tRNA (guanosine(46)-N7)-methyltransferase TrmB [Flavobacteriaceae bacterium]
MGSKNKLKRFRENDSFKNVIQPTREQVLENFDQKGKWSDFFGNDNPIVLELGCGKGEYTVALAQKNPKINYIGVDIKGARFWRGAKTAIEENFKNVAFLRTQIELIDLCFAENEIDEIWITFPDPQIKYTRQVHRLTNLDFLKKYQQILKKDGIVHLKTDSEFMHGYTIGLLQGLNQDIIYAHHNIYNNSESPKEATSVQTFYEKQYLDKNKAITYLKFKLDL